LRAKFDQAEWIARVDLIEAIDVEGATDWKFGGENIALFAISQKLRITCDCPYQLIEERLNSLGLSAPDLADCVIGFADTAHSRGRRWRDFPKKTGWQCASFARIPAAIHRLHDTVNGAAEVRGSQFPVHGPSPERCRGISSASRRRHLRHSRAGMRRLLPRASVGDGCSRTRGH
jgi:hypothetical protein